MTLTPTPTQDSSRAAALAERLEDPQVAASLSTLLDHADLLAVLVTGLDQLVVRSEVMGDSLLDGLQELRATVDAADGPDLEELASAATSLAAVLPKAAPGMVAAVESGVIDRLLASDLVSPEALDGLSVVARGLTSGGADYEAGRRVETKGVVSLARVMRDPDVQRALSYLATVAKAIGRELDHTPSSGTA